MAIPSATAGTTSGNTSLLTNYSLHGAYDSGLMDLASGKVKGR